MIQVLVEIEDVGRDDCSILEKAFGNVSIDKGKIIHVIAIVRNSQGETHMDEYIDQQVSKAIAYEDTKHYVESGKK